MKKSSIFRDTAYRKTIEEKIKNLLNEQKDFLSVRTASSPRAVGDAIEQIIVENFRPLLGDVVGEYSASFARRAMADLAFTDKGGMLLCGRCKDTPIGHGIQYAQPYLG